MGHWRNVSLVLALFMAILRSSQAHGNEPDDYLNVHACIRRALNLPPLKWDPELAKVAQAWAEKRKDCELIHSDRGGENMAMGPSLNGSLAAQLWLDERLDYDYDKNECIKMCGHYTQMVWKNTERIGCGRTMCEAPDYKEYAMIVCNYDPPGNVVGQKPY